MKSKVHSFSTTKQEDQEFLDKTKQKYKKLGINFSWVVVQAIKQYEASKVKESSHV